MIQSSKEFTQFMSETMEKVDSGELSPSQANAIANLAGRMISMLALELKANQCRTRTVLSLTSND